jgi:uncharacterized membrane protein YciS (DUF1049 family)
VWIFRGLVFLVLLFAMVYFFVTNSGQVVDVNFFGREFLQVSIYWVVVVCFMLGFATSFVLAAFREFRFQRTISQLKKSVATKDREIHELRTLPIREDLTSRESLQQGKAGGSD